MTLWPLKLAALAIIIILLTSIVRAKIKNKDVVAHMVGRVVSQEPLIISDDGAREFLILTTSDSSDGVGDSRIVYRNEPYKGKCRGVNNVTSVNIGNMLEVKGKSILFSKKYQPSVDKIPYADIISICESSRFFLRLKDK